MSNVLLIEPDYRSKFPPLGLMRISTFHKEHGDCVTFARGKVPAHRSRKWHKVYVSSLFTWELPRTVATIKYYLSAVDSPSNIVVGGVGATLMPQFIRERVQCRVVEGALDKPDMLGPGIPAIATYPPDYRILDSVDWSYRPEDSYFCRVTKGCVRNCHFCAVPRLEPVFGYNEGLTGQIDAVRERFGEQQHLVLLDNNILATDRFSEVTNDIENAGFARGAKRNGRLRRVDFNQGIDARLITEDVARTLASIALFPVRLAFDFDAMEGAYRQAVARMTEVGFSAFTNYVLFNFKDTPLSLYQRLGVNLDLSNRLGIRVTGFPMRYIPIDDVSRRHISAAWRWRYLRGIQCILLATHGVVSPNPKFFAAAFGNTGDEFLEILAMPDRYIIHRNRFKENEAAEWRTLYTKLSVSEREDFLALLGDLHERRELPSKLGGHKAFSALLEHYYPHGRLPEG